MCTPDNNLSSKPVEKSSKLWGIFFFLLGFLGISFAIYSVFHDLLNIIPLYGTVIAAILIGALSVLIIVYGYRVIRRDF